MESVSNEPQMYVCDPIYHKDKVKGHTNYTLKGSLVPEPVIRRYRDFDALRKKLVERWPGIFIPNIPHKKKVNNVGKITINLRLEMINRFLKKLCNIPYLRDSEEIEYFVQNTSSVGKTLDGFKRESYEDLYNKYSKAFSDYDENFDPNSIKDELSKFSKQLSENYIRIKSFRQLVRNAKDRYSNERKNYLDVMNMLSLYEKETVDSYVNNDENKLIFFNMKNSELCNQITNVQEKIINPYDRLYDAITEDYLETEAMMEAMETLGQLHETYDKLNKNKSKGSKKEDVDNLKEVLKIAAYELQEQMKNFKTDSLNKYYAELSRLENDVEANNKINDDLWETVVKDQNISESN